MLNRVQSMFEYKGLPDTIPQKMIEIYIMTNGHSVIIEHEGKLYVCFGNWGGEPNEYYIPTKYVVANPYASYGYGVYGTCGAYSTSGCGCG